MPSLLYSPTMTEIRLLKKDLFGEIRRIGDDCGSRIVRDSSSASPWIRWLARRLLRREAAILAVLTDLGGIPRLIDVGHDRLVRSYLDGHPLQRVGVTNPAYFAAALHLLCRLHRLGVVHNDLAKEPNLLVRADGSPAFVDFQLAWFSPRRGRLFRWLAYEDLRHLLKHKRTYCADRLTTRERKILANPTPASRAWRAGFKPVYLFVTRRLLRWADREGAGDRGAAK